MKRKNTCLIFGIGGFVDAKYDAYGGRCIFIAYFYLNGPVPGTVFTERNKLIVNEIK